jgi:DNA-binding Xre family transcriptional regulator
MQPPLSMTKLKLILNAQGLTQLDLHNKSKKMCIVPIPKYALSKIYTGKLKNFSVPTLIKLCKCLNLTPNDIVSVAEYDELFKQGKSKEN